MSQNILFVTHDFSAYGNPAWDTTDGQTPSGTITSTVTWRNVINGRAMYQRIWSLLINDFILWNGWHYFSDVIMSTMASKITSFTIVYSTVYSGANHRKHQSSASLDFVRGIHQGPVNSPRKGPVTWKMFPFDDVIVMIMGNFEI